MYMVSISNIYIYILCNYQGITLSFLRNIYNKIHCISRITVSRLEILLGSRHKSPCPEFASLPSDRPRVCQSIIHATLMWLLWVFYCANQLLSAKSNIMTHFCWNGQQNSYTGFNKLLKSHQMIKFLWNT